MRSGYVMHFHHVFVLHVLLEAGVEVADHRLDAGHVLAVEVDDQAEHAVRRRVVRAEVDRQHVAGRLHLGRGRQHGGRRARDARACRRSACARSGCAAQSSSFFAREPHRLAAERVVLAERMAVPVVVQEDPLQVRMAPRSGCPSGRTPRARGSRRSARQGSRSGPARPRRATPAGGHAARARRSRAGGSSSRSASASASAPPGSPASSACSGRGRSRCRCSRRLPRPPSRGSRRR